MGDKAVQSCGQGPEQRVNFISERLQEIEKENKEVANLEGSGDSEGAPAKVDLLSYLICSGGLSLEETCSNVVDFITAGVDTVSHKYICTYVCTCACTCVCFTPMQAWYLTTPSPPKYGNYRTDVGGTNALLLYDVRIIIVICLFFV